MLLPMRAASLAYREAGTAEELNTTSYFTATAGFSNTGRLTAGSLFLLVFFVSRACFASPKTSRTPILAFQRVHRTIAPGVP